MINVLIQNDTKNGAPGDFSLLAPINDLCFKYIVTSLKNDSIINYITTPKIQYETESVVMS